MAGNCAVYGLRKLDQMRGSGDGAGDTLGAFGNDTSDTALVYAALTVYADQKFYLRDSGIYLQSSADGTFNIVSDTVLALSGPTTNITATTAMNITAPTFSLTSTSAFNVKYDSSNYLALTVSSAGATKLTTVGSSDSFEIETGDGKIILDSKTDIDLDPEGNDINLLGSAAGKITLAAASITVYGGDTTGDALVLQGNSADATQKITITGASGTTVGGNLTIASTGTFTTGTGDISILGDATWGTTKKAEFRDDAIYINSSTDGQMDVVADGGIVFTISGASAATKIVFGGVTDWGTGATGTVIDGTGYDWVTQTVGRVNANLNGTAAAASYYAMSVTVNQTSSNSIFGQWTELYFSNSVALTGSDNYAAIWGQVECGTTVTGPDQANGDFMAAGYFNFKAGSTFTTGGYVNGIRVQGEVSSTSFTQTASTTFAGIEVLTKAGSYQPWTEGVLVQLAGSTTGFATTGTSASASGRAAKFAGTVNNENFGDGYSFVESELSLTGTGAGHVSAFGSWVNIGSGTHGQGGNFICAQTNGIWEASGATITGANVIFGMRMAHDCDDTDAAGYFPFSIVSAGGKNVTTALFHTNAAAINMGAVTNAGSDDGVLVPLYSEGGGSNIGYVKIYSLV